MSDVKTEAAPIAWQWRSRLKGGAWDAWERGRYNAEVPPFAEVEERALYAHPPAAQSEIATLRDRVAELTEAAHAIAWLRERAENASYVSTVRDIDEAFAAIRARSTLAKIKESASG